MKKYRWKGGTSVALVVVVRNGDDDVMPGLCIPSDPRVVYVIHVKSVRECEQSLGSLCECKM